MVIREIEPDRIKLERYKHRLLSVLESRKWEWLSPSEKIWLQELWDELEMEKCYGNEKEGADI